MTDKRTFPGAMNAQQREELARKIKEQKLMAEEAQRFAIQKAEAARKAKQRRSNLINAFAPNDVIKDRVFKFFISCMFFNVLTGVLDRAIADQDPADNDLIMVTSLGEAVHEAYDPFFHAGDKTEDVLSYKSKSYRDSNMNDRFKRHMVVLSVEALLLACILTVGFRKKYSVTKDIDLMLEIEKIAKQGNVDPKLVKKMMKIAPNIIGHMSKESSVYFEMLMNGCLDCDNDVQVLNISKAILVGHLRSHPEDMKRVLEVFDEESLPQSIVTHFAENSR